MPWTDANQGGSETPPETQAVAKRQRKRPSAQRRGSSTRSRKPSAAAEAVLEVLPDGRAVPVEEAEAARAAAEAGAAAATASASSTDASAAPIGDERAAQLQAELQAAFERERRAARARLDELHRAAARTAEAAQAAEQAFLLAAAARCSFCRRGAPAVVEVEVLGVPVAACRSCAARGVAKGALGLLQFIAG